MLVVILKRDVRLVAYGTGYKSVYARRLVFQDDGTRVPQLAVFALNYLEVACLLVLYDVAVADCLLVRPKLDALFHLLVFVKCYFVVLSGDLLNQILISSVNGVLAHVVQVLLLYFLLVE